MRQTTKIGGKRVVLTTSAKGKVTVKPAAHTEDELQAAQVQAMRRHPAYVATASKFTAGQPGFTFAADMNAERRGPSARAKATKTGMTPGEPDLRLAFAPGRLVYVENKVGKARLQPSQEPRHAILRALGFTVHVLRAETPDEAVAAILEIVDGELAVTGVDAK